MKKYIRILATILLLITIITPQKSWSRTYSKPAVGDGSEENPFQISLAEELAWFSNWVNESHGTACAKLINDIDMNNISWVPIGHNQAYAGIFDGNHKTISNLKLYSSTSYMGMFGYTNGATLKNFTLKSAIVKINANYVGILAGITRSSYIYGIRIINSQIEGKDIVGSIIGCARASNITNCESRATISGEKSVGGIIGKIRDECILKNMFSSCDVNHTDVAGGLLIGSVSTETGTNLKFAGIVGYNSDAKMLLNQEEVSGDKKVAIGEGSYIGFVIAFSRETLKSGVVAYMLQQKNDADDFVWGQNLSTNTPDEYPVLDSTYKVYAKDKITLTCKGELNYSNSFTNTAVEEEQYFSIIHKGTSNFIEGRPATCTENGIRNHYECSECKSSFEDNSLQQEIFDATEPVKSHNYNSDDICTICNQQISKVFVGNNTVKIDKVDPQINIVNGYNLFKFIPSTSGIMEFECDKSCHYSLWNSDKTKLLFFTSNPVKQTWLVTANTTYYIGLKGPNSQAIENNCILAIQLTGTPNGLSGIGTKKEPFILKNAEHLKFFADFVNGTDNVTSSHQDACAKIADDVEEIDMSSICHAADNGNGTEVSWTPIGSSSNNWHGEFEGNNKTISNLYINGNQSQIGLFGNVYMGHIKNLTFKSATVKNSAAETGILMGYACIATISNIVIDSKSSINGSECTGGIVGNAVNASKFYNCINYAKINGTNKVGGIAGAIGRTLSFNSDNCLLNNVLGYGDVTATEKNSGGLIVGDLSNTTSNGVIAYNKEATLTINGTQVDAKATGSGSLSSTAYTKDEVKSGKLVYALNNGVTDGSQIWYQKLGENGDEYPMMKSTGENTVYGAYHHGDKNRFFSNTAITKQHSVAYNAEAENEENGNHDLSYEAGEYTWTEGEDKTQAPSVAVTYTCKVCGKKETPQMTVEHDAEHDNEAATCTEEGHNYYKTSHTFNDKAVFSNAYTQTLPALGHNMSDEVIFNNSKNIYQKGCTREYCGYHDYYATSDGSVKAEANADESAFTVEAFTLDDATAYDNKAKFTVKELTYKRTFKNNGWQAVYVPFDLKCDQINPNDYEVATINNFHEYEQENGSLKVELEVKRVIDYSTIPALTPCLIRKMYVPETEPARTEKFDFNEVSFVPAENKSIDCASVTRYYQFLGSLKEKRDFDMTTDFSLVNGELWGAGQENKLSPQRWYLKATDRYEGLLTPTAQLSRIAIRVIGEGSATGIEDIHVTTDYGSANGGKQGIYDLQGRKLDQEPESGIYIKNGKKYVK